MKRLALIALLVVVLGGIAVFGAVRVVSAQNTNPETPFGPGYGMMGGGMMNGTGYGPMHKYMQAALAEKLGLTESELEKSYTDGQTFWQIAEEKGFTTEEATQMMQDARNTALEQMVKEGTLTQEQADWMKSHAGRMMGGNGQGGCQGGGTHRGGGMMGGRWSRDG
jgi:hypothetical protein